MIEEIAHIIPTHERPRVAQRLVDSILHFYPEARIYVCDDSREPSQYEGAVNVPATAYDIGLSAKRNLLVQASGEPYVFLWDDDYVCTRNTSVESFYQLLMNVPNCGVVGGEWSLGEARNRNSWFTGNLIPDGALIKLRPPEGKPQAVQTEVGTLQYHEVDLLPNWFLAKRETLEACPWDEELKLNEHLEFFARLAAIRSESETDKRWHKRWKRLEKGKPVFETSDPGRIIIQATTSFSNGSKLSHVGGHVATGDRLEVESGYGKELIDKNLAVPLSKVAGTRPFPLPEEPTNDLKCILTPDTTACHLRDQGRVSDQYVSKRFRRDQYMPLQMSKIGVRDRDMVQWTSYPHPAPDFDDPDPSLLELPPNGHADTN